MKIIKADIPDVLFLEPEVFSDHRGFFFESWNQQSFEEAVGRSVNFVQDNHSSSQKGVLRGLHYQTEQTQGKLVRVTRGRVFDVAVDLRKSSPTFGSHVTVELSANNKKQSWIPEGFAHGFLVLSDIAEVQYKTTDYYHPEYEKNLLWSDAKIGIRWPLEVVGGAPKISAKDKAGMTFDQAPFFY